jgi:hypothetical protein
VTARNVEHDSILAGDARLVLPASLVPDVLVCDPPYRAHVHENATSQDQHTGGNVRHNDFGFASLTEELRTWICQLAAKTRRWSLIYTDVESVAKWKDTLELAGATYIRTLPWVRWSMPCLAGDRPPQGFECIVVAYGSARGRKRWNGAGNLTHLAHVLASLDWDKPDDLLAHLADCNEPGNLTHIAHLALRGKDKFKTEKPLDQLLDLVSWFSDRDELVVDPTSGSGTTGLACKILGRKFIGCELNAEWWEKGNARIKTCNANDLPGSLSPRDGERFLRWVNTTEKEKGDAKERKANTERVRKRLADKKAFLSVVPTATTNDSQVESREEETMMPDKWADAYQRCVTECGPRAPKTPAAERTLPLPFEDEYVAKNWRTAYERCLAQVAEDPDFVAPPKDDSESGFTQPDGTLIPLPAWATAEVDPRAAPVTRVASSEGVPVAPALPPVNGKAKRGKGRPPGAKNKAPPKEWSRVYAWVTTELASSS